MLHVIFAVKKLFHPSHLENSDFSCNFVPNKNYIHYVKILPTILLTSAKWSR